jgi:hypothetical protein
MESKKFAWKPVKVTSGKWTWMSVYYQHKSLYDETTGRPPLNSLHFIWTETEKEKVIRLLKDKVVHNRNIWNEVNLTREDNVKSTIQPKY